MFLCNKYSIWYMKIIHKAISENRKKLKRSNLNFIYYESHHIIPKCMGGTDEVLLTAKEHYICHLLLTRMLEGENKYKMINALIKMSFSKSKGQERYKARSYSLIKSLIAEKNSALFKGKNKSDIVKNNMKGRSGKWQRTDDDRIRMRGANNHMFGRVGKLNPACRPEEILKQKERMKLWWKERKSNGVG